MQIHVSPEDENREMEVDGHIQVERFEYGKVCDRPDGRILTKTVEHGQLGWSRNFPQDLIPFCKPATIGVSDNEFESFPQNCAHGTVLQPVLLSRKPVTAQRYTFLTDREVRPVLCRLGKRPEDGEGGSNRLYTLGRYITPTVEGVDPSNLFEAMGRERLRGISLEETKQPFPVLSVPRAAPPMLNEVVERFLCGAIIFVLSGVPIGISEWVDERTFFTLIAALWEALPSLLRPYLSAGWGVSASISGKLAVTFAAASSERCAIFSPLKGDWNKAAWSNPIQVAYEENGKLIETPFFEDRVIPGRYYAGHLFHNPAIFQCDYRDLPKIIYSRKLYVGYDSSLAEELVSPTPLDLHQPMALVTDFQNSATVNAFRYPGWVASNGWALDQLRNHLDSGDRTGPSGFSAQLAKLTFPEKRRVAFKIAFDAMGDRTSGKGRRGDDVVEAMLNHYGPNLFSRAIAIALESNAPFSSRLQLFVTLQTGSIEKILHDFLKAAFQEEAEDFPVPIASRLQKALNDSIQTANANCAELHTRLLTKTSLPTLYKDWVSSNSIALTLALLSPVNDYTSHAGACERIFDLTPTPFEADFIRMLINWAGKKDPTPFDERQLAHLPNDSVYKQTFRQHLLAQWNLHNREVAKQRQFIYQESTPTKQSNFGLETGRARDQMLAWIRLARPTQLHDPLLRLGLEQQLESNDEQLIADEVEKWALPHSLLPKVAELALAKYAFLTHRIHANGILWAESWGKVIQYWPDKVVYALWSDKDYPELQSLMKSEDVIDPTWRCRLQAVKLSISALELEKWINSWLSSHRHPTRQAMARRHWKWIKRSFSLKGHPVAPIVEICRYLVSRAQSSKSSGIKEISPSDQAAIIDKISGAAKLLELSGRLAYMTRHSQQLWQGESKGLYLRILLELFPKEHLTPTGQQTSALIPYRNWLKNHLKGQHIHPERKDLFLIASKDFYSEYYSKSTWKEAYTHTPHWGVYCRVPLSQQGSLSSVLQAFADNDEDRIELCTRYLNNCPKEEWKASRQRVFDDFLIPYLRRLYQPDMVDKLLAKRPPKHFREGKLKDLLIAQGPE